MCPKALFCRQEQEFCLMKHHSHLFSLQYLVAVKQSPCTYLHTHRLCTSLMSLAHINLFVHTDGEHMSSSCTKHDDSRNSRVTYIPSWFRTFLTVSLLLINLVKTALFVCYFWTHGTRHQTAASKVGMQIRHYYSPVWNSSLASVLFGVCGLKWTACQHLPAPPSASTASASAPKAATRQASGAPFCQTPSVSTASVSWQGARLMIVIETRML